MLYVPEGCAHGFLTLTDGAEVAYQMSAPYVPEAARGTVRRSRVRHRVAGGGRGDQRARPDLSRRRPMTAGEELYKLVAELYPICRSITGDGVRRTLEIVDREIGLEVSEVPTGTQVLDWTVPREWNVRDAWVADAAGERVIDFQASNLHLVSYSVPVRATMPLAGAQGAPVHPARPARLGALPDLLLRRALGLAPASAWSTACPRATTRSASTPPWPTATSPTASTWSRANRRRGPGQLPRLPPVAGQRQPLGDRRGQPPWPGGWPGRGRATATGSCSSPGRSARSPGWPGTRTGSAASATAWSCPASATPAGSPTSAAAAATPRSTGPWPTCSPVRPRPPGGRLLPYGYDERQFCSPGFDLPVGRLSRTEFATYPEYHTSADDLDLVGPAQLQESLEVLGGRRRAGGQPALPEPEPQGEPQLGRRGCTGRSAGAATPRSARWPCCGS